VALWRSTAPSDPAAWLAALGWSAALFDVAERSAAYGRPLEDAGGDAAGEGEGGGEGEGEGGNGARLVDATRL
jgi:hypothetical protein